MQTFVKLCNDIHGVSKKQTKKVNMLKLQKKNSRDHVWRNLTTQIMHKYFCLYCYNQHFIHYNKAYIAHVCNNKMVQMQLVTHLHIIKKNIHQTNT